MLKLLALLDEHDEAMRRSAKAPAADPSGVTTDGEQLADDYEELGGGRCTVM